MSQSILAPAPYLHQRKLFVAVNEYIVAGIGPSGPVLVGGIGVIDTKGRVEVAFWVKPVNIVKAFGHLFITHLPFWPKRT